MKKIIFYSVLCCFGFIPSLVHGADFYFEESLNNFSTGENQIVLKLKTGIDTVNAISGKIEIPNGVEISKINTGSSAVLIWIDRPQLGKVITFSGITPGGFQGDVKLFSFGFATTSDTQAIFKVTESEVVKNDGLGTFIKSTSKPFTAMPYQQSLTRDEKDTDSPEIFTINLGKEKESFDGAYFASFSAQDKKSGIQKYEWAHTWFLSPNSDDWQETVNPIILQKSMYFDKIFVKAVDGEGNIRISSVDGPYRYTLLWIGIILIVTVLCVLFFARSYLYRYF